MKPTKLKDIEVECGNLDWCYKEDIKEEIKKLILYSIKHHRNPYTAIMEFADITNKEIEEKK